MRELPGEAGRLDIAKPVAAYVPTSERPSRLHHESIPDTGPVIGNGDEEPAIRALQSGTRRPINTLVTKRTRNAGHGHDRHSDVHWRRFVAPKIVAQGEVHFTHPQPTRRPKK